MKIAYGEKASVLVLLLMSSFFFSFASIPALYADNENWLLGFSYRVSLTISASDVDSELTHFPVLVTISDSCGKNSDDLTFIFDEVGDSYLKIAFTQSDGETQLYGEVEKWDDSSEEAVIFVSSSTWTLSSSSKTVFYLYYDSAAVNNTDYIGPQASLVAQNVWDNNYKISLQLSDDNLEDSTANDNDGTNYGTTNLSDSIIAGGRRCTSGDNDEVLYSSTDVVDQFTVDFFVRINDDSEDDGGSILGRFDPGFSARTTATYMDWGVLYSGHTSGNAWTVRFIISGAHYYYFSSTVPSLNTWVHITVTRDNSDSYIYLDTSLDGSTSSLPSGDLDNDHIFVLGSGDSGSEYVPECDIDKVTISSVVRDETWIEVNHLSGIDDLLNWGSWEKVGNDTPTNLDFTILDMDDTDNLYAQKQYYTAQYVVTDYDGYADIDYAEFSIMQSSEVRATFRFNEDTSTFSIEAGSSTWDLAVESCSYESSGKTLTMNFMISPKFNALEESDIDISVFVVDDEPESSTDIIQTDYADVVTDLVVSGFACDDDRGNVGQSLNFSGTLFYANDPSSGVASSIYPPDSEFTAVHVYDSKDVSQGSDNSITNGAFSVSFSALSSVDLEAYNPYIDMADAEYVDAEENPTATFISDRIRILTLGADDTRVNVDDSAEIYATAELEYDGHSLGSGDSLTIESLDLVWNNTHFVGTDSNPFVQQKVYDAGEGEETTYGVTALSLDSLSISVIWDRLNVKFTVEDDLVPLNTKTEFKVTIFREYDNSSVSSYSYNINRDGSGFNNPYTTSTFTDISSSECTRTYDFTSVTDNTYGLTAFSDPENLFVAWYDKGEQFIVSRFSCNSSNADVSESVIFDGSLSDSSSLITDYKWDFGDGTSSSGETVIHSYKTKGTYLVTLTVTSEVGSDVYSTYITIGQSDQPTLIMVIALIVIAIVAGIVVMYLRKRK